MRLSPGLSLLGAETAAVLPAIRGALAAAGMILTGEGLAAIFRRTGRKGCTNADQQVGNEGEASDEPARKREPELVQTAGEHRPGTARHSARFTSFPRLRTRTRPVKRRLTARRKTSLDAPPADFVSSGVDSAPPPGHGGPRTWLTNLPLPKPAARPRAGSRRRSAPSPASSPARS